MLSDASIWQLHFRESSLLLLSFPAIFIKLVYKLNWGLKFPVENVETF